MSHNLLFAIHASICQPIITLLQQLQCECILQVYAGVNQVEKFRTLLIFKEII